MTSSTPRPVVSGKPYPVRQVLGHTPRNIWDFAGQTAFVLDLEGEDYTVLGSGLRTDDGVQVFEKDDQGYGRDIRVWTVREGRSAGLFTAEHQGPWQH